MSFTEKKYAALSFTNRIKKCAFAIREYIDGIKPEEYAKNMLSWLNSYNKFSFKTPSTTKEWGILYHSLLNLIDKDNFYSLEDIFDKAGEQRQPFPYLVLLDNIRSPHNAGSIIRTAEAFGAKEVILAGITPDAVSNSKVKRAAMKSVIEVSYHKDAYEKVLELKNEGYQVVSLEKTKDAENIYAYKASLPCAVIFGNEEFGISDSILSISDAILEIPLYGNKNSLNVAVSAGIALSCISKNYASA